MTKIRHNFIASLAEAISNPITHIPINQSVILSAVEAPRSTIP